jgi:hypothetical protein
MSVQRVVVPLSLGILVAIVLGMSATNAAADTFTAAGQATYTVPVGVHGVQVAATGAAGGDCYGVVGGRGASISAVVPVTPGQTLYVTVGGGGGGGQVCSGTEVGGVGGGGTGGFTDGAGGNALSGGGGGGASQVATAAVAGVPTFQSELVVAGGGGGAAYNRSGGDAGADGEDGSGATGGRAGTTSAGGPGGAKGSGGAIPGGAGSALTGGKGGNGDPAPGATLSGGGGGGGYYGGGGGGGGGAEQFAGAGGGGSSYTAPVADSVTGGLPADYGTPASVSITPVSAVLPPKAVLTSPASGGYYAAGQSVPTDFTCFPGVNNQPLASCADDNGTTTPDGGHGHLDTSTTGFHYYTVTATSTNVASPQRTAQIGYTVVTPPTAGISSPATGGTYVKDQAVPTSFTCTEGAYGPGLSVCKDSNGFATTGGGTGHLDTSTLGPHTYTITVTSADGLTATHSISYSVVARPTATISSPSPDQIYRPGQSVPTTFSCAEGSGGPGLTSCNDSNGTHTTSGGTGHLNTSTVGSFTYTVTAASSSGRTTTATLAYTVSNVPTATISAPTAGGVYPQGQSVATRFSCADVAGGFGLASCDDSNGTETTDGGTGHLNTSTLGPHTYTVTVTTLSGLKNTKSIAYTVISAGPTAARIATSLAGQIVPTGKGAKLAAVRKAAGFTKRFIALTAGSARIDWYVVPRGASLTKKTKVKPILVATGKHTYTATGTASLRIKLTATGKSRLKKAKTLKLSAKGTFTPTGKAAIVKIKTFTLKK